MGEFGLPTNGIKADLVQRLFNHYQEKVSQQTTDESPDAESGDNENKSDTVVEMEMDGSVKDSVADKSSNEHIDCQDQPSEVIGEADANASQPARLSLHFGPPKVHPAGPPPEEGKSSKSGPVPLMSLDVAPPPELKENVAQATNETIAEPVQLPRALEEALAYKSERAEEMGVGPDSVASFNHVAKQSPSKQSVSSGTKPQLVAEVEDDDDDKKSKQKKKQKKKKKKNRPEMWARQAVEAEKKRKEEEERAAAEPDVEVEYIQEL